MGIGVGIEVPRRSRPCGVRTISGRLPGAPHIRAVGARLAPARPDPGADVLQGFAHIRGVAQQQALQMLRQPGQAVLPSRRGRCRAPPLTDPSVRV